jgi:hypothetical protein
MRKSQTYFEQISVQKVKRRVKDIIVIPPLNLPRKQEIESQARIGSKPVLHCHICRKPVPVETAKTDGYGRAIHEECYVLSVLQKATPSQTRRAQP